MNILIFTTLISICMCCIISSISLSGWLWEAKKINDVSMCNKNSNPKEFMLCPLNEDILEGDYQNKLKAKYDSDKLNWKDIVNDFYISGVSNVEFIYCDKMVTKCTVTSNITGMKYNLIEEGVYSGYFEEKGEKKVYLYFPMGLVMDVLMGSNMKSLDEFLKIIKSIVGNFNPDEYRLIKRGDRRNYSLDVLFIDFPYDGISTTFRDTIYRRLDPMITSKYFNIIKGKIKKKEILTTFEFFSYFAILSLTNENIYKVLME